MLRPVHFQNHRAIPHPKLVLVLQGRQSRSNPSAFAKTAESNVLNHNTEYYIGVLRSHFHFIFFNSPKVGGDEQQTDSLSPQSFLEFCTAREATEG